jgi:DNA polymerase theta
MLRTLVRLKKKALFILPFVSVVTEKVKYLQEVFESMDFNTEGFYANHGNVGFDGTSDIAVCTIEKVHTSI